MNRVIGFAIVALLSSSITSFASSPSASDACWQRFQAKKIRTVVGLVQCTNKAQHAELRSATAHHDLVRYLETQRLAIAEKVDRGTVSFNAGMAEIQGMIAAVNTEIQKRNALSAPPAAAQQAVPNRMVFCNTLGFSTVCF